MLHTRAVWEESRYLETEEMQAMFKDVHDAKGGKGELIVVCGLKCDLALV